MVLNAAMGPAKLQLALAGPDVGSPACMSCRWTPRRSARPLQIRPPLQHIQQECCRSGPPRATTRPAQAGGKKSHLFRSTSASKREARGERKRRRARRERTPARERTAATRRGWRGRACRRWRGRRGSEESVPAMETASEHRDDRERVSRPT